MSARLLALPGIGPWTAGYIRMRALSDPDVFLPEDAGVLRALRPARHGGGPGSDPRRRLPWPRAGGRGARTRCTTCGPRWNPRRRAGSPRGRARTRAALGYPNEVRDDVMTSPFLPAGPAAPTWYDIVDSPVGRILLTGDERALGGLYLLDAGERSASVRPEWTRRPGGFAAAAEQLAEYFAGVAEGVRPAARAARHPVPARGLGGARQDPLRVDDELRRGRRRARQVTGRFARRRARQRAQPDLDHHARATG